MFPSRGWRGDIFPRPGWCKLKVVVEVANVAVEVVADVTHVGSCTCVSMRYNQNRMWY